MHAWTIGKAGNLNNRTIIIIALITSIPKALEINKTN
jgi:hypothetical protein